MKNRIVLLVVAMVLAAWCRAPAVAQSGVRPVSLVITNGFIVTMDAGRRVIENGAVAIDGADIVGVDTAAAIGRRYRGRETVDAGGQVVMPGLVNTHTHMAAALLRGAVEDLAAGEWFTRFVLPAQATLVTPEFARAGSRLAALQMIRAGTTTLADMGHFEEEVAAEVRAAGLRGVLGQAIVRFPVTDAQTPADGLARAERFIEAFAHDPLITPAVAPYALHLLDGPTLKAARDLSRRHGVPTFIHLAETRDEVRTAQERFHASPVAYLDSLGFLGPGVVAAHGVWLSDADIALLKARQVTVSYDPESNMRLAGGTAPVAALLRAGVPVGLGTDGAAGNNNLDLFDGMRLGSLLQKLQTIDARALPARRVLEMATIGGATVLGLGKLVGSLEPGKRADVIVVGTGSARQTPIYDPLANLAFITRGDDVQTTIVQGRILMRDRHVLSLDEPQVLADARAWVGKVRAWWTSQDSRTPM